MIARPLQELLEALRDELKQSGEMLAILDPALASAPAEDPARLQSKLGEIRRQAERITQAQDARQARVLGLCRHLGCHPTLPLKDLAGHLPVEYRPLFEALLEETQRTTASVRRSSRQLHRLHSEMAGLLDSLGEQKADPVSLPPDLLPAA